MRGLFLIFFARFASSDVELETAEGINREATYIAWWTGFLRSSRALD